MIKEQTINDLEMVEKAIKASEELRQTAQTKKGMYEQQLIDTDEEFKALGTTAQEGHKEIEKIDAVIEKHLSEIKGMIPFELLKEYKRI